MQNHMHFNILFEAVIKQYYLNPNLVNYKPNRAFPHLILPFRQIFAEMILKLVKLTKIN